MRVLSMAVGLAAAGLLAACSSRTPPPEQPSTSATPQGHGSFAHCLNEHGVPAAPGPAVGPPAGVDQSTWHSAMQACSSLAPGPGPAS
ncbi:hypothetical protein Mycsm_05619 [Mycobacterium sp. JS623]|uniref:hypothetical protein n=1 Tax=Mycobacterium sp. JS623 TaxID=212767 RepID=UPI0002A54D91|nr:hypothetical protein [Mycobacterium sp. JS623]AGB25797.1 hypothetical protein Mycsm_05619 [Mycobacterium sp. JS623]